jgi:formylglycine-generating enzyme required for sulfatase activity
MMGSPKGEEGREWDEDQHQVTITKDFYMSTSEITEDQFRQVMGMSYKPEQGVHANDSALTHMAQNPIRISWQEAVKFCKTLSKLEGNVYRLPTEAEWEYACRANSTQAFNTGNTISISQATTKESNLSSPAKCSSKPANAWGLYDMHGNVWEWCSDWSFMYNSSPASDPQGPTEEFANENELDMKVVRGGSYDDPAIKARSANRWEYSPSVTSKSIGFRIVLELKK